MNNMGSLFTDMRWLLLWPLHLIIFKSLGNWIWMGETDCLLHLVSWAEILGCQDVRNSLS